MEEQMVYIVSAVLFLSFFKSFLVFAVGNIVFCELDCIKEDFVPALLMNNFGSEKALKNAFSSKLLQECFVVLVLCVCFYELNSGDKFICTIQLVYIVPVFL